MSTTSKPSPAKPWERAGAGAGAGASSTPAATATAVPASTTTATAPALPPKPANLSSSSSTMTTTTAANNASTSNSQLAASSAYGSNYASRYGSAYGSSYGGYGSTYGSAYSSPYSRFGGGYGGYGSGYGSGYGGYGGFGASPYGFGQPNPNDMSLTRQMESGTAATFQLLQSVVSAFGGFAQMLESTFMATHSSFFAMIGVAEQFANLRNWLGEVLSVFTLLRWVKRMLGWAKDGNGGPAAITAEDFKAFETTGTTTPRGVSGAAAGGAGAGAGGPKQPKPSKKPLIIFFLTVVGLPYLMSKLVKLITAKQEAEARRLGLPEGAIPPLMDGNGQPLPQHMQPPGVDLALLNQPHLASAQQQQQQQEIQAVDPSKLTFVRASHSYQSPSNDEFELSFEKNDIIAVLTPKEERTEPGWWRGRLRDGRIGWFPSTHVMEIPMNNNSKQAEADTLKKAAATAAAPANAANQQDSPLKPVKAVQ